MKTKIFNISFLIFCLAVISFQTKAQTDREFCLKSEKMIHKAYDENSSDKKKKLFEEVIKFVDSRSPLIDVCPIHAKANALDGLGRTVEAYELLMNRFGEINSNSDYGNSLYYYTLSQLAIKSARLDMQAGNYDYAFNKLNNALKATSYNETQRRKEIYELLGDVCSAKNISSLAIDYYKKADKLDKVAALEQKKANREAIKKTYDATVDSAVEDFKRKDYNSFLTKIQGAIKTLPDYGWGYYKLLDNFGEIYNAAPNQAERERLLTLENSLIEQYKIFEPKRAYLFSGRMYLEQTKEFEKAIAELSTQINMTALSDGYKYRGMAYEKLGKVAYAKADYETACKVSVRFCPEMRQNIESLQAKYPLLNERVNGTKTLFFLPKERVFSTNQNCEAHFSLDNKYVICGDRAWSVTSPEVLLDAKQAVSNYQLRTYGSNFKYFGLEYQTGDGVWKKAPFKGGDYTESASWDLRYYFDERTGLFHYALNSNNNLSIGNVDSKTGVLTQTFYKPTLVSERLKLSNQFESFGVNGIVLMNGYCRIKLNENNPVLISTTKAGDVWDKKIEMADPFGSPQIIGFDAQSVFYGDEYGLFLNEFDKNTLEFKQNSAKKETDELTKKITYPIMSNDLRYLILQGVYADDDPNKKIIILLDRFGGDNYVSGLTDPKLTQAASAQFAKKQELENRIKTDFCSVIAGNWKASSDYVTGNNKGDTKFRWTDSINFRCDANGKIAGTLRRDATFDYQLSQWFYDVKTASGGLTADLYGNTNEKSKNPHDGIFIFYLNTGAMKVQEGSMEVKGEIVKTEGENEKGQYGVTTSQKISTITFYPAYKLQNGYDNCRIGVYFQNGNPTYFFNCNNYPVSFIKQ